MIEFILAIIGGWFLAALALCALWAWVRSRARKRRADPLGDAADALDRMRKAEGQ